MLIIVFLTTCLSQQIYQSTLFGNTESLGYYYIDLYVGTPPVIQTVIVDTGSSLTAFPCTGCSYCGKHMDSYFDYTKSVTFKKLSCNSGIPCSACNNDACEYHQSYAEGSSIFGMLVEDILSLSSDQNSTFLFPSIFGCHLRETNLFKSQKVDGLMGIGRKKNNINSVIDNLYENEKIPSNTFSICLSKENGIFTIGGYNDSVHNGEIQWTNMYDEVYYGVKLTSIGVGGYSMQFSMSELPKVYTTGTILDSGTTFTYLHSGLFADVCNKFKLFCENEGKCLGEGVKVFGEPQKCFAFSGETSIEEFFDSFPVIKVEFEGGKVVEWLPRNYLFAWPDTPDYYCVGIYDNFEWGNILGGTFMRGNDVVFDRSLNRAGIVPAECYVGGEGNRSMSTFKSESNLSPKYYDDFSIFIVILVSCCLMSTLTIFMCLVSKHNKRRNEIIP